MTLELMTGRLSLHPKGYGFVQHLEHDLEVFIPKRFMDNAIDGDIVEVEYNPGAKTVKGYEGKITSIIERKRNLLYVIIIDKKGKENYLAYSPILGPEKTVLVKKSPIKLKLKDRAVVSVLSWENKQDYVQSVFVKKIGTIDEASSDIEATSIDYFLPLSFPKECWEQADHFGEIVTKKDEQGRVNLTKLETFTIDPKEAKDYDDALSLVEKNGTTVLYVHIADVSHYVKPGTSIDVEAKKRGNSTYLPGCCLPMLPENLSNHLCSLKAKVKRLAVTVELHLDSSGDLLHYDIYRSVIKSQTRFTYEEAKEVLDGEKEHQHLPTLLKMVDLCEKLKTKRRDRGSFDFAMPDLRLIIDKKGNPTHFERVEYDITHQLVEEFMLKANEIVAFHLQKQGKPALFRVHDSPSEDKMENLYEFIRKIGYSLPGQPTFDDLQKVFQKAKNSPHAYHLAINFIRSMKLAYYSEENVGHFGLSLEHYLHFTSPIRRYSDLVVHRAVFDEPLDNLKSIAKHVSTQERISFKAESSLLHLKKLRLIDGFFDKDPYKKYEATIVKCKPMGIYFELKDFFLEGFIHISELGKDYYIFYPAKEIIEGERTKQRFAIGQVIHVELDSIDLVYKECGWMLSKA